SGRALHPIRALDEGARATWFAATASPMAARKRWIGGLLRPAGALHLDAGAVKALHDGRSLLPAGVKAVDGLFERGDAVRLMDETGREIGRGLVAYGAEDARAIMGRKSAEIAEIVGAVNRGVMIHRDDLV